MRAGKYAAFLILTAATGCSAPVAAPVSAPAAISAESAAAALITAEDVHARISFLASDALRGRDTPSQGLEAAAAYLASEAARLGLEPGAAGGSYFQRWPFPLRRVSVDGTRLSIRGTGGEQVLRHGRDFFVAGGAPSPVSGGVVFAGRTIELVADEAGVLRDRLVMVALPGGTMNAEWRQRRNQLVAAAGHEGASAILFILDPAITEQQIAQASAATGQAGRVFGGATAMPQYFLSHASARRVFQAAGMNLDEAWRSAASGGVRPVTLSGVTGTAALPVEELDHGMPANVVAVLRGSDPALRDEYVVLSAHYDHVGVGTPVNGDSIYNGADDNASGTTGLLQVARAMMALPEAPRRSVIFLWVSGEEKGLLGSRWYSDNPTVPVESIVANINADMIGGNHPDTIVVIGKDYSTLGETVNRVGARYPELGLVVADDVWPEQRFFYRSDQFNFARLEIPVLFFFTGVHRCYHRPCDDVDFVDHDKIARVSRLLFHTTLELANDPQRPRWDPAGLEEVRRLTR
jgi:Zn-dependent M28 family amino/carboxypeptidase